MNQAVAVVDFDHTCEFSRQDRILAAEMAKKRLEARGRLAAMEEAQRRIRERLRTAEET